MSRLKGYIFNNAGTAVEGATVTALEAGTTTAIGSTVESGSDGSWSFTSGLTGKNVDVKIESGSTVRYLKHDDHVQVEHMWVRSDTGNTVAPMRIENATNNASNLLLELVGDNSTRADGDEIYISFKMDDDGGNEHEFARITADATDVSNGNEDGQLRFGVSVAGTMTDVFTINATTAGVSDMTLDVSGDLTLDADGGDVFFKDGGTTFGSATNNSGNLIIKSGTTTALTFTGANVAVAGNATIDGDLTISGDDLVMGTNTADMLLIADGTNFNPTSITSLSEISSVASDDVLLAIDTSGGGLKKIERSTLVAGLATSSGISNVVEDTSPELGGDLDVLTQSIVTGASNRNIKLAPHGTGKIEVRGNTNSGSIIFNCENNSHGQTLKAQAHSAGVTNVLTLPAGGDSTLVSLESTDTLTNKTLTSPKINEDVAVTTTATELNIIDGDTSAGTTAVADGDGIVTNDGGTMRQTTVQTFATYFGSEITAMSNLVTTGTLDSGAISSGFGNIDIGSSTFDTTGAVGTGTITVANDSVINMGEAGKVDFGDSDPDDNEATGIIFSMTAEETLAVGDVVCMHTSGKVKKADRSAVATMPAIGIITTGGAGDATVDVMVQGVMHDTSAFPTFSTVGEDIYVSTTGDITATVPSGSGDTVQKIGVAIHADKVYFNFNTTEVLLA